MNIRQKSIRLLSFTTAILGGLLLIISFARFNTLHEEFLAENFDSVHGARTLLKAGFILELAARDLESAINDIHRRPALLARAAENMEIAKNYGDDGKDKYPETRTILNARLQTVHAQLNSLRNNTSLTDYPPLLDEIRQLAKDFGTAERERWEMLSSANTLLAERIQQMRMFIIGIILVFILIMLVLGWTLLRARRAEAKLQQTKAEIEAIQQTTLDASPLGIAYTDAKDIDHRLIKLANRQMSLIFGYTPEALLGLETSRLHANRKTHECLRKSMAPRLSAGEVVREEILMRHQSGKIFWCSLTLKAIDPGDMSRGVVWTCEDISERKKIDEQLQLAKKNAEAASLAKSEFLANMSHELRTPFAGILGLLDLLQRTELSETQQRYTRLARESTSQMLGIISDVLDFSKIEAGKLVLDPSEFKLHELFTSLAETHSGTAIRKGLHFALELVEPLPMTLKGDTLRLRQIVNNLLSNAIKFTHQGEVCLRVECTSSNEEAAFLKITVSDTGIGLPADTHEHIFQKFSQADSSTSKMFGGTGLGLAICQQLTTLMRGRISVDSVLDKGCRFYLELELPLVPADDSVTAESSPSGTTKADSTSNLDLSGIVVLLVDDNDTNREVFAELLTHYGGTVETAENGEQAILLAKEIRPDVILMDCQMPIIDGQEATRRIRAAEAPRRHMAIIALTAHATNGDRDSCLAAGMDDYLPKPVAPETLVRKVRQWAPRQKVSRTSEMPVAIHTMSHTLPAKPHETTRLGRILLVEDNPPIQEATRRLLECDGYEVLVASHGQAALDILDAAPGSSRFDLVLMDCRMPGMDGWETTRRWRQREQQRDLKPTAIIAVTGCDLAETRQSCREAGANDILIKPYPASSLTNLLTKWLGGNSTGNVTAEASRRR